MHLIIMIAIGVFGGLWLFVKWGEWRERRWERREIKALEREAKRQERVRAMAEYNTRPRTPTDWDTVAMTAYGIAALAIFPVGYFLFGGR